MALPKDKFQEELDADLEEEIEVGLEMAFGIDPAEIQKMREMEAADPGD